MNIFELELNSRQYLELEKLALGALKPVTGFMTQAEFDRVVETMELPIGEIFPLPILLDLTQEVVARAARADRIRLLFQGNEVGEMLPDGYFTCDKRLIAGKVYGASDPAHPGVAHFYRMNDFFLGGSVQLFQKARFEFSDYELTPSQTLATFKERGWKTITGFQTRNIPHKAHEHLLRLALELSDGLFVQPLVGSKKRGDFLPMAILLSYQTEISQFLPKNRVVLGVLSTSMRYAGPREAVFHAIIRRNYGCTHFIVGRDHAGVGNYYGKYEAQSLALSLEGRLGIKILPFAGPYYCKICEQIVSERTCPHFGTDAMREISGSFMRQILLEGKSCPHELMRPEVIASLAHTTIFIDEDSE